MKKAAIIGHFAFGHNAADGQTVKTKILAAELERRFGKDEIESIDTHGGIKTLVKAPIITLGALRGATNVIMMPAHNGVRVFGRLLPLFKGLFSGKRIHYVVIGGWLPELVKSEKGLSRCLKKFDFIHVETTAMKMALEAQGFENVSVLPNFKNLKPVESKTPAGSFAQPYRLCIFSRIMREKGIEDALDAVKAVNLARGTTVFELDIYGQVDAEQTEWFAELEKSFPEYVRYKGRVDPDKSVEVLKDYFALLFPTRFYTEGIPGTLIDAYASGVPVITSLWANYADVFVEGVTGWGYEFGKVEQFKALLQRAADEPGEFLKMRKTALATAEKFLPDAAIQNLIQRIS